MCIITLKSFRGLSIIKQTFLLLLLGSSYSVYADVYKCVAPSKQIVYQPMPCTVGTENQNKVEIEKLTPQQQEEIQNRVKAEEAEQKAEQARQAEAAARWQAEAPQREAAAARQEAEAARREAATSYPMYIPYSNYGYGYSYGQQPIYNPNYRQQPIYTAPPRYNYGLEPSNPQGILLNPPSASQPIPYPPTYMPSNRLGR